MVQDNKKIQLLVKNIVEKKANIMIVGLGQVGLPTAVAFLESGYHVLGFDTSAPLVEMINAGINPIPEKDLGELTAKHVRSRKLLVTTDPSLVSKADVVILCVATPLNSSRTSVDLSALGKAIKNVGKKLDRLKLIIIESTIPPRTMKDFVIPKLEAISGKKSGKDFLVSFCPERISPGNSLTEFKNNDRLIGAEDSASSRATHELISRVTAGKLYLTDTATAEVSKLAENSYRDVNIAFANELSLICEKNNVDVSSTIKLANTHPRVKIHNPGPGVGGPCLPKDPYLLLTNFEPENSLIRTARRINDKMPDHIVSLLLKKISEDKLTRKHSVLILGSSYKPNVNDTRGSPSEMIILRLHENGITDITVHDPYAVETFGAKASSNLHESISNSNIVILATAHSEYLDLHPHLFRKNAIIFDAVRLLDKEEFTNFGGTFITIG